MRSFPPLLAAFCFATLLLGDATTANAEIKFVYSVKQTGQFIGNRTRGPLNSKGYFIWSPYTQEAVSIGAAKLNGSKVFTTVPLQNFQFHKVSGTPLKSGEGVNYWVFSKAEAPSQSLANGLLESFYFFGRRVPISIGQLKYAVPATMSGTANNLISNPANGAVTMGTAVTRMTLDRKLTGESNLTDESIAHLVSRLESDLVKQGYRNLTPPE